MASSSPSDEASCSAVAGSLRIRRWSRRSCSAAAHEPLLRSVVQVALEPAALRVTGLDDARARFLQLVQAGAQLDIQAHVLECDRRSAGDGLQVLWIIAQRCLVHQRRHRLTVAADQRRSPVCVPIGELDRTAVEIGIGRELRQPEGQLE
jgi:hypothetical protein